MRNKRLIEIVVGIGVALSVALAYARAQSPVVPYEQPPGQGRSLQVDQQPILLNGLTSTAKLVVGNPARLGIVYCYNNTAAPAYIQIFDAATAASVTVGTTTPKLSLGIPTVLASGIGPAVIGIAFYKGIVVASTTTATGSTTATMDCNVTYN